MPSIHAIDRQVASPLEIRIMDVIMQVGITEKNMSVLFLSINASKSVKFPLKPLTLVYGKRLL